MSLSRTMSTLERPYISICGLIGAGKTTLAKSLGELLNLPIYLEGVEENPYLPLFYGDMKSYVFPLQIHLLTKRYEQQQQIIWNSKGAVQDRTIYEDRIFCRMLRDSGHMSALDYQTYVSLFSIMKPLMSHPTLIIFVDVTPAECMRRIKQRGREMENGLTVEYLERLRLAYLEFIEEISRVVPVFRVDNELFPDPREIAEGVARAYHNRRPYLYEITPASEEREEGCRKRNGSHMTN